MKSLIPVEKDWLTMKDMGSMLIKTNFLPESIKTKEQAVSIMLKGRELDIPPMQALSQINVIKGKPTISAELMLALIYRQCPTAQIEWQTMTDEAVSCRVKRTDKQAWQSFKWDMKDAEKAGLAVGFSWKKYPRAMLRSRVVSEMARAVFPDAIMGCSYTPEEMGAEVSDEGEVIDVNSCDGADCCKSHVQEIPEPEIIEQDTKPDVKPLKQEPKQTAFGYQGTKAQQEAVRKYAIESGLDEEYFDRLHENMLGKSKDHLSNEVNLLMDIQAKERTL